MRKNMVLIACVALALFLIGGCSQSIEDKLSRAEKYLKNGEYANAKKKIDEIVQADSIGPEAIYGQGLLDQYQSFEWEALFRYIEASGMRNGYFPAMIEFIRQAIDLDYFENARKMVGLYIKRVPDNPEGYLFLVTIDLAENKLDSARANLAKAASRSTDSLDILLAEANIDFHSYDEKAIRKALERLSQTDFRTADHFRQLADLYHYLNIGDSAIHYSRRAIEEDDEDIELRLQLAQYLFDEMRLSEAYELTTDITNKSEEFGSAQILTAKILWAMMRPYQAEEHFFNYMALNKESPIALEKHGDFYGQFGETNMATIEWQAAYTLAYNLKYPDDYLRQLYLKMLNGFLDDRDVSGGVDYFDEGKLLLPDNLEMMFIEATLKSSFPDVADSARMMVDDRVEDHWDDAEWLALAGKYFARRKYFDQAADIYERVIDLPYPQLDSYVQLLDIYKNNKDIDAVDAIVAKLPLRFRGNLRLHELLHDIYAEAGQVDKATEYAEILYQHTNEHMPYILFLADGYFQQGRRDEARKLFTNFLNDFPQDAESHYRMARFEFRNGEYDSVLSRIDKSLAIDTGYAFSFELKGEYFQKMNNMDSAIACYEQAIALHWPTPMAYHNLAEYLLQQQQDLDRAAGLAMGAVHHFGRDRRGYLLLGNIYMAQDKPKMAKLQFFRGTRLFPDDAEFHFLLGKAYLGVDDKAEAKKSLRKSLELNLPPPQKDEAEQLLSGL